MQRPPIPFDEKKKSKILNVAHKSVIDRRPIAGQIT
jgi:hypothetical protein